MHRPDGGSCRTGSAALALLFLLLIGSSGCAYMQHRGEDALDILDVGITISNHARPDFALFVNFWNILPLGYAHVDGKLIGIGNGQAGVLDFAHRDSWGVLLWGAEERSVADDVTTPPGPQRYAQGALRLALGAENTPPAHQYFDCDRTLHLGWIGIHLRIKLDDLADFILGWTTLDIMHDDGLPRGLPAHRRSNPAATAPLEVQK